MNLFLINSGFHHIADQIFDDLSPQDLLQCRAVSVHWQSYIDSSVWLKWWKYLQKKSKKYQCCADENHELDITFRFYQRQMKNFYNVAVNGQNNGHPLFFIRELASQFILNDMIGTITKSINDKFPHWKSVIDDLSRSQGYILRDLSEELVLRKQLLAEFESLHCLPLIERFPDWKEAIFDYYEAENNAAHLQALIKLVNGYYNEKHTLYETHPLHYAVQMGDLDVIELIKDRPIDFDVRDRNGMTPLLKACETGQLEIVKFFLANSERMKINVNARDNNGKEMFSYLLPIFNRRVIKELLMLYQEVQPTFEPLDIDWERFKQIECNIHLALSIYDPS